MSEVLDKIRTTQEECINEHEGNWLVIAGPGTGKTYTIVKRINSMINGDETNLPIAPESILCLTFSDTAAREMRQRIGEQYPVNVFTYHGFCKSIMDDYKDNFNLENPELIDDDMKRSILTKCIDEMMQNQETQLVGFNNEKNNPYAFIKEILDGISNIKMERLKKDQFIYNIENHVAWIPYLNELQEVILNNDNLRKYLMTHVEMGRQQYVTATYQKIYDKADLTDKEIERIEEWENKQREKIQTKVNNISNNITKMKELWQLYERYEKLKTELNYIDFSDMINNVLDEFEDENSNLLEKVAQKYEYVIVDEYQDTNTSQNEIVFSLAKCCPNIFVVGDDDQIIYTFQGAHLDTIHKFLEKFDRNNSSTKVNVKCFTDNYRSTQPILDVSKALAELQDDNFYRFMVDKNKKPMSERDISLKLRFLTQYKIIDNRGKTIEKNLIAKKDGLKDINEPVEFYTFKSKNDERDYIITKIIDIKNEIDAYNSNLPEGKEPKKYSDIAILTYSNEELTEYSDYLKANKVPVEMTGGKNIFDIPSVNVFISYLQFLTNPEKYYDKILSFMLQKPFHIDPKDYMEICSLRTHYKTLIENIKDYIEKKESQKNPDIKYVSKQYLRDFVDTYYYLQDYIICENYKTSLLEIGNRTGIFDYYFNEDCINKVENTKGIKKLLELADSFFTINKDQKKSFSLFVDYLSKMLESGTKIKLDKEDKPTNAVQLSTYHSSKGREFEYVFMPYLVAGKWDILEASDVYEIPQTPVKNETYESFLDRHYQEQYLDKIKLLYVGMTRTKRKLTLSYADVGGMYGKLSWFFQQLLMNENLISKEEPKLIHTEIEKFDMKYNSPSPDYDFEKEFKAYLEPAIPNSFSVTALNEYKNCPKQYFFNRVLKLKVDSGNKDDLGYGNAVHSAFEEAIKYVMDNKEYPDANYVKDVFNKRIAEQEISNPENTKASAEVKIFGENGYYNKYFVKLANPDEIPSDVKYEKNVKLDNKKNDRRIYAEYKLNYEFDMPDKWKLSVDNKDSKIIFNGSIDRLDKDVDGKYIIYDYKTKENCDNITPSMPYFYQMVFYKYVLEKQNPGIEVKECYFLLPLEKNGNHKIMVHEQFIKETKSKGTIDVFGQKVDELYEAIDGIRGMEFEKPKGANCNFCSYGFICNRRLIEKEN